MKNMMGLDYGGNNLVSKMGHDLLHAQTAEI
jgi:hypothetical protein